MVTSNRRILFILSLRRTPTIQGRDEKTKTKQQTAKKKKSPETERMNRAGSSVWNQVDLLYVLHGRVVPLHTEVTDQLLLQISPLTSLRTLALYISPVKKKKKNLPTITWNTPSFISPNNRVKKYCMLAAGGVKPFIHPMAIYGNTLRFVTGVYRPMRRSTLSSALLGNKVSAREPLDAPPQPPAAELRTKNCIQP